MANGHEADEHLGHAEVAETPCQAAHDGDDAVGAGRTEHGLVALDELVARLIEQGRGNLGAGEEAGNVLQEGHRVLNAARSGDGADKHRGQGQKHERALHEIGGAHREIAAHERVEEHDDGADDHHHAVVPAEQRREQLAHGDEAGGGVDGEEQKDDDRGDGHEDVLRVVEAVGEEVGHRDGVAGLFGVLAQALGHELPVQIGADGQADGRPHGIRRAGEVGHAGQAHEEPPRHIRRFGRQGREPRSQAAAAEEVLLRRRVGALGVHKADDHYYDEVEQHGKYDLHIAFDHVSPSARILATRLELPGSVSARGASGPAPNAALPKPTPYGQPFLRSAIFRVVSLTFGIILYRDGVTLRILCRRAVLRRKDGICRATQRCPRRNWRPS